MLKHYCRRYGIPRWPYRKRQSVLVLIDSIQVREGARGEGGGGLVLFVCP